MTLTAEFALILLVIKRLLLHWLHQKYSSNLSGFGLSSRLLFGNKASEIPVTSTSHATFVNKGIALSPVVCKS